MYFIPQLTLDRRKPAHSDLLAAIPAPGSNPPATLEEKIALVTPFIHVSSPATQATSQTLTCYSQVGYDPAYVKDAMVGFADGLEVLADADVRIRSTHQHCDNAFWSLCTRGGHRRSSVRLSLPPGAISQADLCSARAEQQVGVVRAIGGL